LRADFRQQRNSARKGGVISAKQREKRARNRAMLGADTPSRIICRYTLRTP